jgi:hypothetical protein
VLIESKPNKYKWRGLGNNVNRPLNDCMTEMKLKRHKMFWTMPALYITSDRVDFKYYNVRINDIIYTSRSPEFVTAFDGDRIIRILQQ